MQKNIDTLNNLLELFFQKYKEQDKKSIFLESLNENKRKYSWEDLYININKLSLEISRHIKKGERCLIVSENRPEWMMSDLSIMLSEGITVPTYTTYTERDYEHIINDCTPTIIIISNKIQYQKVKNIISKKNFIKKVIVFDKIDNLNEETYLNLDDILEKKKL